MPPSRLAPTGATPTPWCLLVSGELRDLGRLAQLTVAVLVAWVVLLGWRPGLLPFGTDAIQLDWPVANEALKVGGDPERLVYRATWLGGARFLELLGLDADYRWAAALGLSAADTITVGVLVSQVALAWFGVVAVEALRRQWGSSELPNPWWFTVAVGLGCALTPYHGVQFAAGHPVLVQGELLFCATGALLLLVRSGANALTRYPGHHRARRAECSGRGAQANASLRGGLRRTAVPADCRERLPPMARACGSGARHSWRSRPGAAVLPHDVEECVGTGRSPRTRGRRPHLVKRSDRSHGLGKRADGGSGPLHLAPCAGAPRGAPPARACTHRAHIGALASRPRARGVLAPRAARHPGLHPAARALRQPAPRLRSSPWSLPRPTPGRRRRSPCWQPGSHSQP